MTRAFLLLALVSGAILHATFAAAQPYEEQQQLNASDADDNDSFGSSVAVGGDVAFVGAYYDEGTDLFAGSAYVFERDVQTGAWVEVQKLTASDGVENDLFGSSASISGDVAFVGAPGPNSFGSPNPGAAYVFERDAQTGAWAEVQKLTASDGAAGDLFGYAVSVSGGVAFVGAWQDGDLGFGSGSAYVFTRDAQTGVWSETQKLLASDGTLYDHFGQALSVSGDVAFVGVGDDDAPGLNSGSVYVFARNAQTGTWAEAQNLTASDGAVGDDFGQAVSVSGDVAVIGAPDEDGDTGAAYVFERDAQTGAWAETQKLTANNGDDDNGFGYAVSVSDDVALIGAYYNQLQVPRFGAAYVFTRDGGTWDQTQRLTPPGVTITDGLGFSVAVQGGVALVGAILDDAAGTNAGSAFVFERNAVAVTATGDGSVPQGGTLTVAVTAQNLIGSAVTGSLVLDGTGPDGQMVTRTLASGTLPAGATVSRSFRLPVGNAPVGTWTVVVRVEDASGQTLGSDTFEVEVTPSAAVGSAFGAEEVAAASTAAQAPVQASVVGPNPFRDRTALAFELAEAGAVRLSLHDVLGREVVALASGEHAAGRHVVPVSAGALPSGVYVWRLEAGGAVTTGQVTVAR